ncbi:OprD family porin [Ectopseudomonas oleovorans]|uniref:OprD family porin n=1 Tax=Ectopseudomonas oleovorans TaxID=301 RepID=A0AA42QAR6_ECTOL|nr:OprD family porin [Pseudomonas oleovorans]MDH1340344.1 OprD family porin [Pseudomonas oleovorans]MDH1492040.1 OprD family porin [Pseudomonas oleovorans]WGG22195.1 OprD family porin [Pseudomonas oleovorans]
MQVMKWSVIALAVAAGTSQMAVASSQSESKGFVEDSSFNIFNRVLYMNRDFKNGAANGASDSANPAGYREETGLGIRLLYESGFTQGTVGVGVDAHSLSSIKLDSGRGRYGTGQFAQTGDGRGDDTQTEVGGAVKFRVSDTVLKYGNQFVESPVFTTDDSRILPEVATGTLLTSNEIAGLELTAGRFTALSSQTGSYRDSINGRDSDTGLKNPGLTAANIVGASYSFTENFSGAIHASDVDDYFKKQYINLNYNLPLAEEQALNFDLNAYRTKDDGQKLAGDVDNKIWSLAVAYSLGAHKFTLAHQRSSGDSAYAYGIDGNGTIWLANSVQYSDFDRKDERSWQARYDLNMAQYGVPGLSFMTRYIYGDNIDTGVGEEGKEHEFNFETKYVIQEGPAKDLSFRLRSAIWRANSVQNAEYGADNNDFRLIIDYPLSVL